MRKWKPGLFPYLILWNGLLSISSGDDWIRIICHTTKSIMKGYGKNWKRSEREVHTGRRPRALINVACLSNSKATAYNWPTRVNIPTSYQKYRIGGVVWIWLRLYVMASERNSSVLPVVAIAAGTYVPAAMTFHHNELRLSISFNYFQPYIILVKS